MLRREAAAKGEKYFFLGTTCKQGHIANRFVSDGHCVYCNKEKSLKFARLNPEKHRQWRRRWEAQNRIKLRLKQKQYRERNLLHVQGLNAKAAYRWHKKNPEKARLVNKAWKSRNRIAVRAWESARRARIATVGGKYTPQDVEHLKIIQKGECYWCKQPFGEMFHVDHVWPISKGGSNGRENIALACPSCNCKKYNKTPMEFAARLF